MTELNKMMTREGLPGGMRIRLRQYFHQSHHIRQANKRTELLELMSPTLRSEVCACVGVGHGAHVCAWTWAWAQHATDPNLGACSPAHDCHAHGTHPSLRPSRAMQVAWEINKEWLQRVWFLEGASLAFLVQLSLSLKAAVFAPGEIAPKGPLYIVNRGLVLYGGCIYTRGKYWGEDMIVSAASLHVKFCALAMNYVECFTLAREDLEDVAEIFPDVAKKIRRHAVRLATRRAFVLAADNLRAERATGKKNRRASSFGRIEIGRTSFDDDDRPVEQLTEHSAIAAAASYGSAKAADAKQGKSLDKLQREMLSALGVGGHASFHSAQPSASIGALSQLWSGSDARDPSSGVDASTLAVQLAAALQPMLQSTLQAEMSQQIETRDKMLGSLLQEQQRMAASLTTVRKELAASRDANIALGNDVRVLRNWVVNDAVAKLKA